MLSLPDTKQEFYMTEALVMSPNRKPRSKRRVAALTIALGSLLAACSTDKDTSGSASNSASAGSELTVSNGATAEFTFDDHATPDEQHIGVKVYGDYTLAGKNKPNGGYNHGDQAVAVCGVQPHTTGREIPYPGFTSDAWAGFDGADGKRHYAPLAFIDIDGKAFVLLDPCPIPPEQ
jgi:hypothetical protein